MSKKTEDLLKTARERFDLAVEAEREMRQLALDDLKFRAGEQWPSDVKSARELDRRPCLTINRLPQFVRQVCNDQRQNRPSIKVNPVDEEADQDTAKILQGLIRHIEYSSSADQAYDTAFESAVTKGIGYFRAITQYVDSHSFEQEILIKRIRNSFSVYLDPSYQEPDASDANWGFIFEDVSHDDFKSQYKESKLASMNDWTSIGNTAPGWASGETCRVAEYFYKSFKDVTLCLLSSQEVVDKSELPDELPEGLTILAERKTTLPAIKWAKINALEVLEETDWPGQWIPIVPVIGDELDIDGRKVLEGVIRHAKDPQKMYNYWASSETETIALAPRAPFVGVEGQFEGHEDKWKSANVKNHAFLEYKPKSIGGQPVGPPQRNVYEPPVQAITMARAQSADDLKATTGIYDASLGNRSNENSGIAIQRRNLQAQTNNYHFIDNLSRSLRHLGRILIDLIPKIYDSPRTLRIIGEDGESEMIQVNQIFEKNGEMKEHNFSHGRYDVTVSTGPSFTTKRQEAVESMLALTKAYPAVAQVAGDLIVRNMDWQGAKEIADRLKKTLPPGLAEESDENKKPLPPQVSAQMQQMQQMIENLTQSLNVAQDKLETKSVEIESKERIEFAKIQAQVEIELAKLGSRESIELLHSQISQIQNRLKLLDIHQEFDQDPNQALAPEGVGLNENQMFTGEQSAPGLSPNMEGNPYE